MKQTDKLLNALNRYDMDVKVSIFDKVIIKYNKFLSKFVLVSL